MLTDSDTSTAAPIGHLSSGTWEFPNNQGENSRASITRTPKKRSPNLQKKPREPLPLEARILECIHPSRKQHVPPTVPVSQATVHRKPQHDKRAPRFTCVYLNVWMYIHGHMCIYLCTYVIDILVASLCGCPAARHHSGWASAAAPRS